jgi:hypothetical protein
MGHLHTEPGQHDVTASAYIVRIDGPEPVLLLHMHKKLNQYLQFGGHVEHHEDPWQAITHEIAEESGYLMQQLRLLQPSLRLKKVSGVALHPVPVTLLTHEFPGLDHFHTDMAFAFTTRESPAKEVEEGESTIMRNFTAAQLRALPEKDIPSNVREIGLFILEDILSAWEDTDSTVF